MARPLPASPPLRMRTQCVILLLIFSIPALLPCTLLAQSFSARTYGQDDGLDNLAIVQLAQDPAGHLWIATENGLYRYDGARFTPFGPEQGLNDARDYNLHIDRLGTLWVATRSALCYFDGERFREVLLRGHAILVGTNSKIASNSRGELIVSTISEGLLSIMKDPASGEWMPLAYADRHPSFRAYTADYGAVQGITFDHNDRLWFGCGTTLCGFSAPQPEQVAMPPQHIATLEGVPAGEYDSLLVQKNGRLWARSRKFIVTWLPGDRQATEGSAQLPSARDTVFRYLCEDHLGNVLTSTTAGFATWDGSRWQETARTTQGPIEGATALLADHEGGMWIGTSGKGLLQALGYRNWVNYTLADGLRSQLIFGVSVDQRGRLWLGSPVGIDILPPGTTGSGSSAPGSIGPGNTKPVASPLAREPDARWIQHFQPTADGGMWAGAMHGHLYLIRKDDRIARRATVPGDIKRIRLDAQGTLWIASVAGLFHLECPAGYTACNAVKVEGAFAGTSYPEAMQFDHEGNLWVATRAGLFVMRNGTVAVTHVPIQNFNQGLSELAVAPDQTLWLAGRFPGVIHVRASIGASGNATGPASATILDTHTAPELASDYVMILAADDQGRIWAGTDHGINVLRNGQSVLINMQDGLVWSDTDWNSFFEQNDGSVWIGTSGGVSHLVNPEAVLDRPPFQAEIDRPHYERLTKGDQILQPGSTTPWGRGTLNINFSGLTFRDNRSLIYHYRIEGLDTQTIESRSPFAHFQLLGPDSYNFVVVAEDRGHNAFSAPASFRFTLSPPWWQTRSFCSLESLGIAGIALLLWRWSNKALLAQRERLQALVAERTAELQILARTDALTGLLNRGAVMSTLAAQAETARQHGLPLCVAIVDLDHFKRINDTLGHAAGDQVLREAARRLAHAVRASDFVGRYGGEEFLVIFRDINKEFGQERCEAIRKAVCEEPIQFGNHQLAITASIGVAWTCNALEIEDALVARADHALYNAKENGRNRVELAA